jgi:hypothetical protein
VRDWKLRRLALALEKLQTQQFRAGGMPFYGGWNLL